jgi:hypothetical protein
MRQLNRKEREYDINKFTLVCVLFDFCVVFRRSGCVWVNVGFSLYLTNECPTSKVYFTIK